MDLTQGLPLPKGKTRQQLKAKADRAEDKVKKAVRAACVERDGPYCRVWATVGIWAALDASVRDVGMVEAGPCSGDGQWAHMHTHRRSQTRGQEPEKRHTTAASLMLCQRHHDQYDGRDNPRLLITRLSHKGANGPLKFRRGK